MGIEVSYRLYRHRNSGRYVSVRRGRGIVSVFAESGVENRSQTLYLEPDKARKLLDRYEDAGVTMPESNIFRVGRVFEVDGGGLMLCIETDRRENRCTALFCGTAVQGVSYYNLTDLCDDLAAGRLRRISPAPPEHAQLPENGRLHIVGNAVFTPFCSGRHEPVMLYPENGCFPAPVAAPRDAVRLMMHGKFMVPLPGELFAVKRPGQLPPVLQLYNEFDNIETNEIIRIRKISHGGRNLECSPYVSYDALMTGVCTRRIVPHINIHF